MPHASFAVYAKPLGDGISVISVSGDVDVDTASLLERELLAVAGAGAVGIVVDLSDVGFLDSAGLRALVRARERQSEGGGAIALASSQSRTRDVLAATKLDEVFAVFSDREQAIASVRSG